MIVTPTRNQLFVRTLAVRAFVLGLCFSLPSLGAAQSLPPGWATADVGTPVVQGAVTFDNGTFAVRGAGADIWGRSDEFMFVYQQLTGDGDIIARVSGLENTHAWAKAGVMIRESLAADSTYVLATASAAGGRAFQRRRVTGGASTHTTGGAGAAPVWLKLERRAATLTAYRSADGVTWTAMGTDVISMPETVHVGLAVTAHNVDAATAAVFSNVVVTPMAGPVPAAAPPTGWTSRDIGGPAIAGSTDYNAGSYTVRGGGSDIWADFDQFRYVYRQVTGDIDIVARVAAVENVDVWTKAGVMIRDALTANAAHASMFVTPGSGVRFHRRPSAGGLSQNTTAGTSLRAPYWVRLERRGTQITAFHSSSGTAWTQVGTMALSLPTVYVGLAVTSHNNSTAATALFDNVVVRTPGTNQAPTVSLTAPANNASFTAPASVMISATAADTDGTVAKVDFYNGTTLLGSDTTSPYAYTWSGVPVGTYTLRAVATDNGGATTTSAARTITVQTTTNQPPSVALTGPPDGNTYTAPATITMTATASDVDGTVAGVDFYAGTTPIGTDASSPYSMTWNSVPAGTYSITAVARDNSGASTTSAARTVFVASTLPPLPSGWTGADIGQPAVAGSARENAGTFTLEGAGNDIWDTSDQFQFAYRQFTGDIEIISRVVSLENTDEWAKAGVMIRQTLAANAVHASLVVTPGHGTNFYRRLTAGDVTQPGATGSAGAPFWVKLERRGTVVTAFQSSDGVAWTSVGTMTMSVATMYVGLAVTSHNPGTAATGVFDNVVVRTPAPVNQAPTVALTAPANGATFPAPGTVTINANASDTDGTVAKVEFYNGTTLLGADTTAPYSYTWSGVPTGTYTLKAIATDNGGAATTSATRTITVGTPPPVQHRAIFNASSNHATAVDRYVLNIYPSGANPDTATPVATRDLGKPSVVEWRVQCRREPDRARPLTRQLHRDRDGSGPWRLRQERSGGVHTVKEERGPRGTPRRAPFAVAHAALAPVFTR